MKKKLLYLLLFAPLVVVGQEKIATDTTKLNEITISENRMQTPFSKIARNIQIITKEQIAKMPIKSINEALSYVAGVDVRQRGPFGTQADISIDGGTFEQTLILLNGVKISDAQTAHHSMNIPLPLAAVERIEVLKGPAARIYGINALTGAINIVTKTATENNVQVALQGGSSFAHKDKGDGSGRYAGSGLQVALNLAGKNQQHLLAIGSTSYNGQRYNSSATDQKFFYQGNTAFDKQNSINLMAGYLANAFGANGFYAAPGDRESFEVVKTSLLSLGSSHQISKKITLRPRVSNRHNWDDYRYYRNNLNVARSLHQTNVWTGELNSSLSTGLGEFGLGFESRSEEIKSTNIGNRQRYNHGAYAEYKNDRLENLTLNLGTYLNYNTQYGWQVFPGADVAYLLSNFWKLSANVGSSQRIPSFTDLYLNQRPGNIGNPNLKSENAWQYELSLQFNKGGFKAQAGYFYRNINDFIDWVRSSNTFPYQPENFGQNKMNGLNVNISQVVKLSAKSSLFYQFSYNHLSSKGQLYSSNITSKYVSEHLKNQGLARIVFDVKPISLSYASRWLERLNKKNYVVSDIRLAYLKNNFQLYAEGTNIFNAVYTEVGAVPLPKSWFALGANLKFKL